MDKVAYRYFTYFVGNLKTGDQFTAIDFIDYIKDRCQRHTPTSIEVGAMVVKHKDVVRINDRGRLPIYEVV